MKNVVNITINGRQMEIQFQDEVLRDAFAIAALGAYALEYQERMMASDIAHQCYSLADAMLEARKIKSDNSKTEQTTI